MLEANDEFHLVKTEIDSVKEGVDADQSNPGRRLLAMVKGWHHQNFFESFESKKLPFAEQIRKHRFTRTMKKVKSFPRWPEVQQKYRRDYPHLEENDCYSRLETYIFCILQESQGWFDPISPLFIDRLLQ